MENKELLEIYGGASMSGPILTVLFKAMSYLYDLGRSLGTNIRRIKDGFKCAL